MSVLVFKKLQQLKAKTFGLGSYVTCLSLSKFGFGLNYLNQKKKEFFFVSPEKVEKLVSPRLAKSLQNLILVRSLSYSAGFLKQVRRRVELLKFNRSWRGARHFYSLPVRGQRTKTNARIQKSRRKRKV